MKECFIIKKFKNSKNLIWVIFWVKWVKISIHANIFFSPSSETANPEARCHRRYGKLNTSLLVQRPHAQSKWSYVVENIFRQWWMNIYLIDWPIYWCFTPFGSILAIYFMGLCRDMTLSPDQRGSRIFRLHHPSFHFIMFTYDFHQLINNIWNKYNEWCLNLFATYICSFVSYYFKESEQWIHFFKVDINLETFMIKNCERWQSCIMYLCIYTNMSIAVNNF